jgi:hypothetical protein
MTFYLASPADCSGTRATCDPPAGMIAAIITFGLAASLLYAYSWWITRDDEPDPNESWFFAQRPRDIMWFKLSLGFFVATAWRTLRGQ